MVKKLLSIPTDRPSSIIILLHPGQFVTTDPGKGGEQSSGSSEQPRALLSSVTVLWALSGPVLYQLCSFQQPLMEGSTLKRRKVKINSFFKK